jgi:hypothetical protein
MNKESTRKRKGNTGPLGPKSESSLQRKAKKEGKNQLNC